MKQKLTDLYAKNGTKKVLASLLSILAGLLLGSIVVIIVGLAEQKITTAYARRILVRLERMEEIQGI